MNFEVGKNYIRSQKTLMKKSIYKLEFTKIKRLYSSRDMKEKSEKANPRVGEEIRNTHIIQRNHIADI